MHAIQRLHDDWWRSLGFSTGDILGSSQNERAARQAKEEYLRTLRPTRFTRTGHDDAEELTLYDVVTVLAAIDAQVADEIEDRYARERALGWKMIRAAYAADDASDIVSDGAWAGFTKADATAWCWNLYQYEPHGFTGMRAMARRNDLTLLTNGGLPDSFGYPQRARELALAGSTPELYRTAKETVGAKIFDPRDVTFGGR